MHASALRLSIACLTLVLAWGSLGCQPPGANHRDESNGDATPIRQEKPRVVVKRQRPKRRPPKRLRSYPGGEETGELPDTSAFKTNWLAPNGSSGYSQPGLAETQAWQRIEAEIGDAVGAGPTEVVFLVDVSPSARAWHAGLVQLVADYYEHLPQKQAEIAGNLSTRIGVFTDSLTWLTQEAEADERQVAEQWRSLPDDSANVENTFAALKAVIPIVRAARLKDRKEVLVVVLTDEAGNDSNLLFDVFPDYQKYGVPVHVLGVPAPFGRRTVTGQAVEGGSESVPRPSEPAVVIQGPETRQVERLHLYFPNGRTAYDEIDSGFGPYGLEMLCRETGGRYWSIFGSQNSFGSGSVWPSIDVIRFDPGVMKKYRPRLETPQQYLQFVESHRCCQVLLQAAKLGPIPVLTDPTTGFSKGEPARLKREIDIAQQAAAKVEVEINAAYDLLKQGLSSRSKLDDPRWCASYDLAMGRIAAAKARVDGYNAMLAALKRGLPETNQDAMIWSLVPADSTDLTSTLRSLAKQAQEHLERVAREHPGTPWEFLAKEELKTPLGWKWEER